MKQARKYFDKVDKIVREELISEARKILRDHDELDEFTMGMGDVFFSTKDGEYLDLYERDYFGPVADIIYEWNSVLKLTGESIRFTADGEIVTNM